MTRPKFRGFFLGQIEKRALASGLTVPDSQGTVRYGAARLNVPTQTEPCHTEHGTVIVLASITAPNEHIYSTVLMGVTELKIGIHEVHLFVNLINLVLSI